MLTKLATKDLRTVIQESVRESVRETMDSEFMKIRAIMMPEILIKEQKEIERLYKKPTRKVAKTLNCVNFGYSQ